MNRNIGVEPKFVRLSPSEESLAPINDVPLPNPLVTPGWAKSSHPDLVGQLVRATNGSPVRTVDRRGQGSEIYEVADVREAILASLENAIADDPIKPIYYEPNCSIEFHEHQDGHGNEELSRARRLVNSYPTAKSIVAVMQAIPRGYKDESKPHNFLNHDDLNGQDGKYQIAVKQLYDLLNQEFLDRRPSAGLATQGDQIHIEQRELMNALSVIVKEDVLKMRMYGNTNGLYSRQESTFDWGLGNLRNANPNNIARLGVLVDIASEVMTDESIVGFENDVINRVCTEEPSDEYGARILTKGFHLDYGLMREVEALLVGDLGAIRNPDSKERFKREFATVIKADIEGELSRIVSGVYGPGVISQIGRLGIFSKYFDSKDGSGFALAVKLNKGKEALEKVLDSNGLLNWKYPDTPIEGQIAAIKDIHQSLSLSPNQDCLFRSVLAELVKKKAASELKHTYTDNVGIGQIEDAMNRLGHILSRDAIESEGAVKVKNAFTDGVTAALLELPSIRMAAEKSVFRTAGFGSRIGYEGLIKGLIGIGLISKHQGAKLAVEIFKKVKETQSFKNRNYSNRIDEERIDELRRVVNDYSSIPSDNPLHPSFEARKVGLIT